MSPCKLSARAKVSSCKKDPSCISIFVQFYLLVQKCLRTKVSSCNFVHSYNFVRSCEFDSYPCMYIVHN